ncbi:MAG: hypothetical protein KC547_07245 [Anaerolineae bacterium]|nr:hypothetical protein [Anaerolineae bacterium]
MEQPSLVESLTSREQEILKCVVAGYSNSEIARELYLAPSTVKWYIRQLNAKLGTSNRRGMKERAQALGLFESPAAEPRNNLPLQLTPFIGRQSELAELRSLLEDPDHRLVTILALGGMGKTRLALVAAKEQLQNFADGVFFVSLAAVGSAEDMVTAIAESISFSFSGSQEPLQQLLDHCRDRALLLVLDNFEHLLEASSVVLLLVQTAPKLKLLTTSREKLNLKGETVIALSGMHFPDGGASDSIIEYDAARLFVQTARHVRPHFQLKPGDDEYLARICQQTAGMPLALVLAAGWVDVLTLGQIATGIQQSLDILETEQRDVPARQRSVQASFDYSWARLSENERACLMKLSLFQGGFTVEAAQTIADADLRQLRRLVDKGMIQIAGDGHHIIHELIRQIVALKLEATLALKQATLDLHCEYYLTLLAEHEHAIREAKGADMVREIGNIRAAWRYATTEYKLPLLRLALYAFFFLYDAQSWYVEGELMLELLLSQLKEDNDEKRLLQGDLLILRGCFLTLLERFHDAEANIRHGLSVYDAIPMHQRRPLPLAEAAVNLSNLGADIDLADRAGRQALVLFEQTSERWGVVMMHTLLAGISHSRGDLVQSQAHLDAAQSLNNPLVYVHGIGWALQMRAYIAHTVGHFEEARKYREQAYAEHAAIHYNTYQGSTLAHLGSIALDMGDDEAARRYFEQALSLTNEAGEPILGHMAPLMLGFLAAYQDDDAAIDYLSRLVAQYQVNSVATGNSWRRLLSLGALAALCGRYDEGLQYTEQAMKIAMERGYRVAYLDSMSCAGHCLLHLNQTDRAQAFLHEVLRDAAEMIATPLVLEALTGLAQLPSTPRQQTIVLLTLILQHPSSNRFGRHMAQRARTRLKAEVSERNFVAAVEQGQALTLDSVLSAYGVDSGSEIAQ